jgi:hypothetical protein
VEKMKKTERLRESLSTLPDPEYWKAKLDEGWTPVAIEWERPLDAAGESRVLKHEVPYGLRVSQDCHYLEEHPTEKKVLKMILALIVGDKPLSEVAEELNRRDYRMRSGARWTQVTVFNTLPRLIEVAPEILSAEEWSTNKKRILRAV